MELMERGDKQCRILISPKQRRHNLANLLSECRNVSMEIIKEARLEDTREEKLVKRDG